MRLGWLTLGALVMMPALAATVAERLAQYGPAARARLRPAFAAQGVAYPPPSLVLVGLKDRRVLQLYAPSADGAMRCVRAYPILAASGAAGPKLREGDYQVPEGIYHITFLNPNSSFHLSLRLGYPNDFDRRMARRDGRARLGGDIMIHGGAASAGCLAMGDEAAEDLFVLAADTGLPRVTVILSPVDFRTTTFALDSPAWTAGLYAEIKARLARLPLPPDEPRTPAPPAAPARAAPARPWLLPVIAGSLAAALLLTIVCAAATAHQRRQRAARRAQ